MAYIENEALTEEMLQSLARLVKYDSVQGEPLEGKPFGEGPAAVLKEALEMAEEMGFRTKNVDNYCGYAEIGEGHDIIGLVGHLDIVPAGVGWDTDPFTMTRKGDKVYGRGVSDDKGGVIASLYAAKRVKESGIPLNKRIRVLMGCNEESGSRCMAYYNQHEEPITVGFTPDGDFPGIHGEKGMLGMVMKGRNTKIVDIHGGFVSNAVCSQCTTVVRSSDVDLEALARALKETDLPDFSLMEEDGLITIFAQGVSAHASRPLQGVNACGCTMEALKNAGMEDDFVDFYVERIGISCDGRGCGLKCGDDYGDLTLNNGIIKMEDGVITGTIDCRYPVTFTPEKIREMVAPYLDDPRGSLEIVRVGEPLFYSPDSPLVRGLLEAYQEITGDLESQPKVIGGGTYAKSIPGIIAFGCEFPGGDNHIHDANESLVIKELGLQQEIYYQAILKLLEM
ncbi:MAG: Sapep family Mn(2+)-dependent dipeptidase [Firmicutes bacterium]|nr:Sapep family Mn(2+)-dependent dipeptidase [Bacillota bacterium]